MPPCTTDSCSRIDLHAIRASDENEKRGLILWEARCQCSASGFEAACMEQSTVHRCLHSAHLSQPCTLVAPRPGKQDVRHCVNSDTNRHGYGRIRGGCQSSEPSVGVLQRLYSLERERRGTDVIQPGRCSTVEAQVKKQKTKDDEYP